MDSPWDEDVSFTADSEWTKISNEFTNTGYREGITAGKESALQEGFDDGFASVGVPIGRELGLLRGISSALLSFLISHTISGPNRQHQLAEVREISAHLSNIRFSDISPRDLEAEEHAQQHLGMDENGLDENEEVAEKRKMEGLEDLMSQMTHGTESVQGHQTRPTLDDIRLLRGRLMRLSESLDLIIISS